MQNGPLQSVLALATLHQDQRPLAGVRHQFLAHRADKIYKYVLNVWPTSNLFKVGHRIRLEISSSNFPMWDRNPNTGNAFGQDPDHDEDHPSEIRLPIVTTPIQ
jgi:predicted acyl esterase